MNIKTKRNKQLWQAALVATAFAILGCNHKSESKLSDKKLANEPWTNMLSQYKGTILTGSWQQAESYWMDLHLKINSEKYNEDAANQWIQFQIEFLDKTKADPYRDEIRIMAIQELGYFPEVSRAHLSWLKQELATNSFSAKAEIQKANEVVAKLELNNKINN